MTTTAPALDDAPVPAPAPRIRLQQVPGVYEAMTALDKAAADGLDPVVAELVRTRASQLNGCAFCLDMHSRDARRRGVPEHKLHTLAAWRETPFFTARERAALALTEAVTRLGDHGVPDEVYDEAARRFEEPELARLLALAVAINAWNRIGVATRMSPTPRHDHA
ncbi:carboxymuconolactone decarboxylase family protein [Streptacidiphilus sp. ASG 303]|uniref:carboxymuconolactone decarboxylase family protein n=1 Tax=Streptacidiphilus sp. ASG 303 TaxID=2896847 RepID=UPI001E2A2496|nr:carboxymuconolactone decarboxylase family protein [Streptacidiphilus sp. ASG 303]MCD0481883.1 carboxymuconolactone decarboxylase family protein [Streptacidiphilus sp. ASG 303]